MMEKARWLDRLLDLLPASIRPKHDDRRFLAACAVAYDNGWTPDQLAPVLARHGYERTINPPLILIMQLERVGERPPTTTPAAGVAPFGHGCIVCPPRTFCPDPARERIPPEWAAARFNLLTQLMHRHDLADDEREQAMAALIHQQQESAWSTSV